MPKNHRAKKGGAKSRRPERRLSVRGQLRAEPDLRRYARAVVALALAQAEREAEAERAVKRSVEPEPGS